jgi:hypothetical protein
MAWFWRGCPGERALARAFSSPPGRVQLHVHGCTRCRDRWASLDRLGQAVRALPTRPLSRDAEDRIRLALLTVPESRPRRRLRLRMLFPVAAMVTSLFALALTSRFVPERPAAPSRIAQARPRLAGPRGRVRAVGAAAFALAGGTPDEVVRLRDGTVHVEVQPLATGERFRVVTGDGEVEVRGTAFEVDATGDRLTGVRVEHGRVEVRPQNGLAVLLNTGEVWSPPVALPKARTSRRVAARHRPLETDADRSFRRGWDALAAGDPAAAAVALERATVAGADDDDGIAEDARFWRAVALVRAQRPDEARVALGEYLRRDATSPRAAEASALLGWLLLDTGDLVGAQERFAAAAHDDVPNVRRSGVDGLAAVRARRQGQRAH